MLSLYIIIDMFSIVFVYKRDAPSLEFHKLKFLYIISQFSELIKIIKRLKGNLLKFVIILTTFVSIHLFAFLIENVWRSKFSAYILMKCKQYICLARITFEFLIVFVYTQLGDPTCFHVFIYPRICTPKFHILGVFD